MGVPPLGCKDEFEANSFTKQIVWETCGINHEGILVPGSTGVPANMAAGVELLVWIVHRSQLVSVAVQT